MTKTQSQKLAMYMAVLQILRNHPTELEAVPALIGLLDELERQVTAIQLTTGQRRNYLLGIAKVKADSRQALIRLSFTVSQAMRAYARQTGDVELEARSRGSMSGLRRLRQVDLPSRVETMLEEARALGALLEPYGVHPDMLDALGEELSRFRDVLVQPRRAIVNKRTATFTIRELFRSADALLNGSIAPLVDRFRNTSLYRDYEGARRVVGARRKAGAGRATPAPTDAGLLARIPSMPVPMY